MSIIKNLEKDISILINKAGYEINDFILFTSNRKDLGDFQINDAMTLAKKYHEPPIEIAKKIVNELENDSRFTNVNIAGPGFINLSLSDSFLTENLTSLSNNLEENIDKVASKKIILDYGGANVAKALHVGHLRSANLGESLKRLATLLGYETISDAHLGDYGRPLGLVILEIKKRYPTLPFFDPNYQGSFSDISIPITNADLEEIYPYASNKAKEDATYLEEARIVTTKIQNQERGYFDLWRKIVELSKEEIKKVYDNLDVYYDLWQGESDEVLYFDKLKQRMEDANVLEESNGALIIDVKKDDDKAPMPPLLFIKSNGSISYETTDLATILEREENYHPDEIWYFADGRQELHFEQVFRAARLAKLVPDDVKLEFIGFGTMNGKDGKPFKTRSGGVLRLQELIDLAKDATLKKMNKETVPKEKREDTAEIIAISALKYADLLPYRKTDYIFEVEKFTDLEGKTGPYLLYSTIRMKSLLEKSKNLPKNKIYEFTSPIEKDIALTILNLPRILTKSLENKALNEIAEYLYQVTSLYNTFYAENHILTETDCNKQTSWLTLTSLVYQINLLLLDVLGMKVPEKM